MLRPERMSRVSVTGATSVMDDAVEALHQHGRLHLSDYDGGWERFEPGSPVAGADEASEKLVTVRSLESILDVDAEDAGPTRIVTDEALEEELETVRQEVNELDDRRDAVESDLRAVEDRLDAVEPFAELGIDLDLLSGYDSLEVAVGRGDRAAVVEALADAEAVRAFGVLPEDDDADVFAVFARPAEDAGEGVVADALVGVRFEQLEVPAVDDVGGAIDDGAFGGDGAVTPEAYVEALEHRREELATKLDAVEAELEELKVDAAGFLLAAEERLSIDVQKREAPLSFATTEHSFVAEGWVPADEYDGLAEAVLAATDDRVEVEELERVDHEEYARRHAHEEGHEAEEAAAGEGPSPEATGDEGAVAADGSGDQAVTDGGPASAASGTSSEPRSDGGTAVDASGAVTMGGEPPVELDNGPATSPFELLVESVGLPRYDEWDPTIVLFLTFPLFFGFMIGDLGYGLLYMAIGYALYTRTSSSGLQSLGGIALWAGAFTVLFGVLYGEVFGLHQLGELYGGPVMHKGLQPKYLATAQTWFIVTILAGVLHITVGHLLGLFEDLAAHGPVEAVAENGSWALMLVGVWVWVFSMQARGSKPEFLFTALGDTEAAAFQLGFTGLEPVYGTVGLAMLAVGLVLLIYGEGGVGLIESLQVLVHVLSYTRIAAVLLAKAGMAFVVNLLVFGAYSHEEEFHFIFFSEYAGEVARDGAAGLPEGYDLLFGGLVNVPPSEPVGLVLGAIGGLLVLVVGHLTVLALGVTSAGIQGLRLEYVEFFSKFYEGGGTPYDPFGYERRFTTED